MGLIPSILLDREGSGFLGFTSLKTNLRLENHHVQKEIHLHSWWIFQPVMWIFGGLGWIWSYISNNLGFLQNILGQGLWPFDCKNRWVTVTWWGFQRGNLAVLVIRTLPYKALTPLSRWERRSIQPPQKGSARIRRIFSLCHHLFTSVNLLFVSGSLSFLGRGRYRYSTRFFQKKGKWSSIHLHVWVPVMNFPGRKQRETQTAPRYET